MLWPKTGATYYYVHLGLLDKGSAIKGLLICNSWDVSAFRPAGTTLLSTVVPWGMNMAVNHYLRNVSLKLY